mmetsp:Transcript_59858/g.99317  ORF Transcript_59858/g.99317 Transcript_59858/m.99317 type:complete len:216 (+) Transcript_59858:1971-2618(+)
MRSKHLLMEPLRTRPLRKSSCFTMLRLSRLSTSFLKMTILILISEMPGPRKCMLIVMMALSPTSARSCASVPKRRPKIHLAGSSCLRVTQNWGPRPPPPPPPPPPRPPPRMAVTKRIWSCFLTPHACAERATSCPQERKVAQSLATRKQETCLSRVADESSPNGAGSTCAYLCLHGFSSFVTRDKLLKISAACGIGRGARGQLQEERVTSLRQKS